MSVPTLNGFSISHAAILTWFTTEAFEDPSFSIDAFGNWG